MTVIQCAKNRKCAFPQVVENVASSLDAAANTEYRDSYQESDQNSQSQHFINYNIILRSTIY